MSKKEKIFLIAVKMVAGYIKYGVSRSAAELAFYLLFSLFPLLMVFHSLLSVIPIPNRLISQMTVVFPTEIQRILWGYLEHLQSMPYIRPFLLGTLLTVYFLGRAVRSIMHSFRDICEKPEQESVLRSVLISVSMTSLTLFFMAGGLALIVLEEQIVLWLETYFVQTMDLVAGWRIFGILASMVFALLYLLLCYRLLSGASMRWRNLMSGAVFALAGWLILTQGFAFYVKYMSRYSLLYGSIGAVIVLMIWLHLSASALLMGEVLNHILQFELDEENRFSVSGCK